MEIKHLTNEQVNQFCLKFDCSLAEFKPSFDGKYYLKMFTGYHGPQPEFNVDETSCVGINYYKNTDISKQWVNFLKTLENEVETTK